MLTSGVRLATLCGPRPEVCATVYDSARYVLANRWDPRHLDTVERTVAPTPGARVLEVGCGQGHLLKALVERGIDVLGVDANPHATEASGTDRVRHATADALPFPDASFDAVISFHVIEHVPDVDEALAEMTRVLVPDGRLLLVYPWEPVRGFTAIPASFILHGHPFKARQIHRHSVRPRHLEPALARLGLRPRISRFQPLSSQFFTVADKPVRVATPDHEVDLTEAVAAV